MTRRPSLTSLRPAFRHFRPLVPACIIGHHVRFRLAQTRVVLGGLHLARSERHKFAPDRSDAKWP